MKRSNKQLTNPMNRGAGRRGGGGNKSIVIQFLALILIIAFLIFIMAIYHIGGMDNNNTSSNNADTSINSNNNNKQVGSASFEKQLRKVKNEKDNPVVVTSTEDNNDTPTIAYAVSITGCGSDPITEGAAVLKHSIHLSSKEGGGNGNGGGKYGYKMYAIVHPSAIKCALPLKDIGYTILQRETPVNVDDIEGKFLREKIVDNGCCGEKELIKFEAYTLIDHPIVVHLDLDTLILKPLDMMFDLMLLGTSKEINQIPKDHLQWIGEGIPNSSTEDSEINAIFTRDYNMVLPHTKYKPVQGGFLILRPDMDVYKEIVNIVKVGDFRDGKGWGGKVGPFYGSMTFQGLLPYYYDVLHPNTALEVNRCIYNQMCDNPRTERTINDIVHGKCRTGQKECEDCRERSINDVITTHYTLCQKPWHCLPQDDDRIQERLCRKLHHEWFRIRNDYEQNILNNNIEENGYGIGTYQKEHFFGYCKNHGKRGYIPINLPKTKKGGDDNTNTDTNTATS